MFPVKRYLFNIVFLSAVFSGCTLSYGEGINVSSDADLSNVKVGDMIHLTVKVDNPSGLDIILPDKPDLPPDFSLFAAEDIKTPWPTAAVYGKEYVIGIYTTGKQVIPPVKVKYKNKGSEEWSVSYSPRIPVEVTSLLDGNETDIKDIKGLALSESIRRFVIAGAAILLLLALILVTAFYIKRRRDASGEGHREKLPPHEIAYRQLAELRSRDLVSRGMAKEYYIELSDIARHYLENRFFLRAPEMTTEEFLASLKGTKVLPAEHKKILEKFLSHCDMVKFAKYGPTPVEATDSINTIEEFVDTTKKEEEE